MSKFLGNWLIQRAQQNVERAPDDAKAWSKLYGYHVEQQDSPGFLKFCRDFIRRQPAGQQGWKFLRLVSEGTVTTAEAQEFAREIVRRHPGCERAWSNLDMELEKAKDTTDWITFCREIATQHPNNMFAWSRLMRELKHEAKHADLVSACLHAIKLKPDAQTWVNLAEAYAAQSKLDEAITAYQKALELKPDFLVALNGLGCIYHTKGFMDEAILYYQRAIKLRKDDATPWVWMALAHMQKGELQKARDAIGKVKATLPLVATMLSEELSTLPENPQEADNRVAVNRLAFNLPKLAKTKS
ncbi:MAG: Photosystem I assembly protein Ycf3 [Verrucomicrobiae bacterium]|nr:Photosystem I assembly protein Ycf3 [Verrucomicrobiae bacterium]